MPDSACEIKESKETVIRKNAAKKNEAAVRKAAVRKGGTPMCRGTLEKARAHTYGDGSSEDEMSRHLYEVFSSFVRNQEQRAATLCVSGEEGLLHFLAYQQDGVSSGFLRNQMEVGTGRMADILRRLEEKGMIQRGEDPCDCRKVIVHITGQGRDQADRTSERLTALYGKMRAYLGEDDSRELIRILKRLSGFQG